MKYTDDCTLQTCTFFFFAGIHHSKTQVPYKPRALQSIISDVTRLGLAVAMTNIPVSWVRGKQDAQGKWGFKDWNCETSHALWPCCPPPLWPAVCVTPSWHWDCSPSLPGRQTVEHLYFTHCAVLREVHAAPSDGRHGMALTNCSWLRLLENSHIHSSNHNHWFVKHWSCYIQIWVK